MGVAPMKARPLPEARGDETDSQASNPAEVRGRPAKRSMRAAIVAALRDALRRPLAPHRLLYLALRDELTGLYNRRAFRTLASESLRLAHRQQCPLLLFFADVDGLKRINDRFGHGEGDRALSRAAAAFKATFAEKSDIAARLGGDEFVALAVEEPGRGEQDLYRKLHAAMSARGARERRYTLSFSVGVARFVPNQTRSLNELMGQADEMLYRHKRALASCGAPAGADNATSAAGSYAVTAPTPT